MALKFRKRRKKKEYRKATKTIIPLQRIVLRNIAQSRYWLKSWNFFIQAGNSTTLVITISKLRKRYSAPRLFMTTFFSYPEVTPTFP